MPSASSTASRPPTAPASGRVRSPDRGREAVLGCPALLLAAALALGGGPWTPELPVEYAVQHQGSVNGIDEFVGLCRDAGARVRTATRWSTANMERASVVVWFDEDGVLPNGEERLVVEEWLRGRPGRVLLYVARDYDAEADYWRLLAKVDPAKAPEYEQWAEGARLRASLFSALDGAADEEGWLLPYEPVPGGGPAVFGPDSRTRPFEGEPAWTAASQGKHDVDLPRSWRPGALFDVLLGVAGRSVLLRRAVPCEFGGTSALYVAANGSFLFNLPLRLEGDRRLARKLVEAVHADAFDSRVFESGGADEPSSGGTWVFLTAGKAARNDGPANSLWNFLVDNPVGALLQQASGLGLLALVAAWPILGRARRLTDVHSKDFGRHVEALGRLLARTCDEAYARRRIREYDQHGRKGGRPPPTSG